MKKEEKRKETTYAVFLNDFKYIYLKTIFKNEIEGL